MLTKVTNWGNYPVVEADLLSFDRVEQLLEPLSPAHDVIARGLGRCYGDSALSSTIVSTQRFSKYISFDGQTGVLTCQAGVSLADIIEVFLPRGWFLPVTPGTKFVTVGGAIAADVHGKNHHAEGSFCDHVLNLELLMADGSLVRCSPQENAELFELTCGGMGLTGIITTATIKLRPVETSYIREETMPAANLQEIMDLFEQEDNDWVYSVAWIDCLATGKNMGRSVMMRGEHAKMTELGSLRQRRNPLKVSDPFHLNVPFNFPSIALNSLSVRAFNTAFYHKFPRGRHEHITDYDTFFYPLDFVNNWNRIYGRRGFTQYQFVLPMETSREGLPVLLNKISRSGLGSFLAVLKLFGDQNRLISFPRKGYTLALDFPINRWLFSLFDELDELVMHYGGRLYLAKDVRMSSLMFRKGYPNTERFVAGLRKYDPRGKFSSLQSKRIGVSL